MPIDPALNPVTSAAVRLALMQIIRRKREKNRVRENDHKPGRFAPGATFDEIQKELEKTLRGVAPQMLDAILLPMVRAGELRRMAGVFTLPSVIREESAKARKHWSST
jgi:hypothetical protein